MLPCGFNPPKVDVTLMRSVPPLSALPCGLALPSGTVRAGPHGLLRRIRGRSVLELQGTNSERGHGHGLAREPEGEAPQDVAGAGGGAAAEGRRHPVQGRGVLARTHN